MAREFTVETSAGGRQPRTRVVLASSATGDVVRLLEQKLPDLKDGQMIVITRKGGAESRMVIPTPQTG